MANSLPKHKPDYRLWVDTVEDIKLLVDEANNYKDPRVTIGTIIYAADIRRESIFGTECSLF